MRSSNKRPFQEDEPDTSDSSGRPNPPGGINDIRGSRIGSAAWTNQGNISNSTVFIQTQQAPTRSPTPRNEASQPDSDEQQTAERRQRLLESLDFPQIDARKTTIRTAQRRTCQWLTTHTKYRDWLDPATRSRHHGFLWMRGKAGAGKSTMMKHIYLKAKRNDSADSLTASFFFNARGSLLEKSTLGMYRSLLLQLFKKFPDLQNVLDDTEYIPRNQQDCPNLEGLKHLLEVSILNMGQRTLTCFIDALDECDENEVRDMVKFFEELANDADEENIQLRICLSSRPYPTITVRHGILVTLEDEQGHAEDLEKYVDSNLRIEEPSLLAEMKSKITEKAGSIFLWVVLVVDILNKEEDAGGLALRTKLSTIPRELSKLFKNIVRRDNESLDRLKLCVFWILCAERPLTPAEFRHALWVSLRIHQPGQQGTAVDVEFPDATNQKACEKLVTSSSKGLAEITKNAEPTVQFIHESVRDFLIKEKGLLDLWPELGLEWEAQAHETIKLGCDSYLRMSKFRDATLPALWTSNNMRRTYPLLEYCCQYTLHHANHAAAVVPQDDFILDFFNMLPTLVLNFSESRKIARYPAGTTRLYILADRGLTHLTRRCMDTIPRETSVYCAASQFGYPLFAAIAHDHRDTAAALLGLSPVACEEAGILKGFKYKKDMKGCKAFSPLSWAADQGNLEVAKALIQQGANVNELDRSGYTALHRASMAGHGPVVEFLIKADALVNAEARKSKVTVLLSAAGAGHTHVVRILLESGARLGAVESTDRMNALMVASMYGKEMVRCFLHDAKLDVNASEVNGDTALHLAAMNGHGSVVETLLTNGAHLHSRNMFNKTAFDRASDN